MQRCISKVDLSVISTASGHQQTFDTICRQPFFSRFLNMAPMVTPAVAVHPSRLEPKDLEASQDLDKANLDLQDFVVQLSFDHGSKSQSSPYQIPFRPLKKTNCRWRIERHRILRESSRYQRRRYSDSRP